jgi:hypothetical protein
MQATGVSSPVGPLELPRVTRLGTPDRRPSADTTPSKPARAWLGLTGDLVAHVAATGAELTRAALPVLLEDAIHDTARFAYAEGLTRRGLAFAHSAAMTYLGRCQVDGLRPEATRLTRLTDDLRDETLRRLVLAAAGAGPRLGLVAPDGPAAGLVLDRLHYTHLAGLVLCDWMSPQVHADLQLGVAVAGDAFAGVRVIASQAFASSVHLLPTGERHVLGGCSVCIPRGVWA